MTFILRKLIAKRGLAAYLLALAFLAGCDPIAQKSVVVFHKNGTQSAEIVLPPIDSSIEHLGLRNDWKDNKNGLAAR